MKAPLGSSLGSLSGEFKRGGGLGDLSGELRRVGGGGGGEEEAHDQELRKVIR